MTVQICKTIVDALPAVSDEMKARILSTEKTQQGHQALMAAVPAMQAVETGGTARAARLGADVRVVAWNLERCYFPQDSAALLAADRPDVVLLSEMDAGMARTGQRHTTAELADALGLQFAYGVEFFELGLGGETERPFCTDTFNAMGWHGNAVLSAAPPDEVALIRLSDEARWFISDAVAPDQPRIGERMAIAAILPTAAGPVCVVSTHFESHAKPDHRAAQMRWLMADIDAFAGPDMPVILGGDLNTGLYTPNWDWREEALFGIAGDHGYSWAPNADGHTTGPSLVSPNPSRTLKLDWLAGRGVLGRDAAILGRHDPTGRPLSDHAPVRATFLIRPAP